MEAEVNAKIPTPQAEHTVIPKLRAFTSGPRDLARSPIKAAALARVAARQPLRYDWGMSFGDTAFIFVLALLIFGPKKLPEIARQVGKALNEFKRASNEFKAQIQSEIDQLEVQEKKKKAEEEQKILPPATPPPGAVHASYTEPPSEPSAPSESVTHLPTENVNPPVHDTTNV